MREIVDTIGTPSEKVRTAIFMSDNCSKTQQQAVAEMQEWSIYPVPESFQLPVRVLEMNEDGYESVLSEEANVVCKDMTPMNRSIFMFGWAAGYTTITSNGEVVKQIEKGLDAFENLEDDVYPSIWLCPMARSLVGKEKRQKTVKCRQCKGRHRRGVEGEEKVMKLPDSLHREEFRRQVSFTYEYVRPGV